MHNHVLPDVDMAADLANPAASTDAHTAASASQYRLRRPRAVGLVRRPDVNSSNTLLGRVVLARKAIQLPGELLDSTQQALHVANGRDDGGWLALGGAKLERGLQLLQVGPYSIDKFRYPWAGRMVDLIVLLQNNHLTFANIWWQHVECNFDWLKRDWSAHAPLEEPAHRADGHNIGPAVHLGQVSA
jgi:hypothetical protein